MKSIRPLYVALGILGAGITAAPYIAAPHIERHLDEAVKNSRWELEDLKEDVQIEVIAAKKGKVLSEAFARNSYTVVAAHSDGTNTLQIRVGDTAYNIKDSDRDGYVTGHEDPRKAKLDVQRVFDIKDDNPNRVLGIIYATTTGVPEGSLEEIAARSIYLNEIRNGRTFIDLRNMPVKRKLPDREYNRTVTIGDWNFSVEKEEGGIRDSAMYWKQVYGLDPKAYTTFVMFGFDGGGFTIYEEATRRLIQPFYSGKKRKTIGEEMGELTAMLPSILQRFDIHDTIAVAGSFFPNKTSPEEYASNFGSSRKVNDWFVFER